MTTEEVQTEPPANHLTPTVDVLLSEARKARHTVSGALILRQAAFILRSAACEHAPLVWEDDDTNCRYCAVPLHRQVTWEVATDE